MADLLQGNKLLGSKRIFKGKVKANGNIDNNKARLVVKGYKQKKGMHYIDAYSRVTRIT